MEESKAGIRIIKEEERMENFKFTLNKKETENLLMAVNHYLKKVESEIEGHIGEELFELYQEIGEEVLTEDQIDPEYLEELFDIQKEFWKLRKILFEKLY